MKKIFLFLVFCSSLTIYAQKKESSKMTEKTFKVEGVCEQCKDRIEASALRIKGVKLAEWTKSNKQLKVIYNNVKTDDSTIQKAIAMDGHQTPKFEADSISYGKLPDCCKYKHGAECGPKTH